MTDAVTDTHEDPPKASKKPLLIGVVLALVGAGSGYLAVSSGMISIGRSVEEAPEKAEKAEKMMLLDGQKTELSDIAFVPLDPIIVSLNHRSNVQHLRFRAQLEVNSEYESEVSRLSPRIMDVLNSYLRAIDFSDIDDSLALTRLRAQMLRRIQIVTGRGRVRDLLIMEFVLN